MPDDAGSLGTVAIQVLSSENSRLLTEPQDRKALSDDLTDTWTIQWLPPIGRNRPAFVAGHSESTTVLLYLLGIQFLSLAKPFVEEIAKEAGKDFWAGIKKLISKIHKRQTASSYQLYSTIYVFLELKDDFVAIEFQLDGLAETTLNEIEDMMAAQILEIAASWDEIQGMIKRFQVGVRGPDAFRFSDDGSMIHVICPLRGGAGEKRWQIHAVSSVNFYDQVWPKPPQDKR